MSVEEENLDKISDEDMNYDREDDDLRRKSRGNYSMVVERLQPSTEINSYKSVSEKLQFLTNNNTYVKKQIQKMIKIRGGE